MHYTKYFTEDEYKQLLENGADYREENDYPPVAKLFMTNTNCVWLINKLDPEDPDIAFGLCDLGMGSPEIGYVSISELEDAQNHLHRLEHDLHFQGKYPLMVYARATSSAEEIIADEPTLKRFNPKLEP